MSREVGDQEIGVDELVEMIADADLREFKKLLLIYGDRKDGEGTSGLTYLKQGAALDHRATLRQQKEELISRYEAVNGSSIDINAIRTAVTEALNTATAPLMTRLDEQDEELTALRKELGKKDEEIAGLRHDVDAQAEKLTGLTQMIGTALTRLGQRLDAVDGPEGRLAIAEAKLPKHALPPSIGLTSKRPAAGPT